MNIRQKVKISCDEAAVILGYKKYSWFSHWFCAYDAALHNNNEGHVEVSFKWWARSLFFIPYSILQFFYLLWDGGIKEFEVLPRNINYYNIVGSSTDGDETEFGRLKIIMAQH